VRGLIFEAARPESDPVERTQFTAKVTCDVAGHNLRIDYERHVSFLGVETDQKFAEIVAGNLGVIDGVQGLRGGPELTDMISDRMASTKQHQRLVNPHVILKDVLADPSRAKDGGTANYNGAPHNLLIVADEVAEITFFINSSTGAISKLETEENDWLRRDTELEVEFEDWVTASGGLRFPTKASLKLGGQTLLEETRSAIEVNGTAGAPLFAFAAGAAPVFEAAAAERGMKSSQYYQMFAAVGLPRDGVQTTVTAAELAPGVFHVTGGTHHSMVVEQSDKVILAEAPLDEARTNAVIAWIKEKFPGKPITVVVPSHHHVDHTGGLRTAAAEASAPVIVHEKAAEFWEEVFKNHSHILPDALERKGTEVKLQKVADNGSFKITDSVRPVTVYHVPSTHAEDLVVVVADNEGVLFVVDIFSPGPTAAAGAGGVELNKAITQHKITGLKILAGGHGGTNTWDEFKAKLSSVSGLSAKGGEDIVCPCQLGNAQ
jgi:glyoxylase-like metal-dependent hydrolase (beta-lactamase superfamily II)